MFSKINNKNQRKNFNKKPVFACKDSDFNSVKEKENQSWNPILENSILTPPTTPTSSCSVNSKWKEILENHDKVKSKNGKRKHQRNTQKQNPKKSKYEKKLEKNSDFKAEINIDIGSISSKNFTEQLIALELIQDYFKNN